MAKYIDKSALVAEIERKYETNLIGAHSAFRNGKIEALREVKDFLNTLEVKEVDLEKEIHNKIEGLCKLADYMEELAKGDNEGVYPLPNNIIKELEDFAKQFFELGLSVQLPTLIYKPSPQKLVSELGLKAQKEEPVSEDLENHIKVCVSHLKGEITADVVAQAIRHGVRWEKDQMMKDAVEAQYQGFQLFLGQTFVLWNHKELPFEAGDKVKLIIIKED